MPISTSLGRRIPTDRGDAIEITFVGQLPPGSAGNAEARRMREEAERILEQTNPVAVLFNLLDLEYEFGDSICGLAYTVVNKGSNTPIPACVLAEGRTAKSLRPLFEKGWAFEIAGVRLFEEEEDALRFLHAR